VDVAELARQIEYKAAPAPLIAVQGLANTFSFDPSEERLTDARAAREWLLQSDLATPDVQVGRRELDHLLECRAAIRDLLDSNLTGRADPAASVRLAHLAVDHPVTLTNGSGEALSLDLSPATSVDGVISQMIGIVFQAQLEGQWSRLKVCASDECRWAFFDSSRNQGGTWCQMETCGNRVKNRTYRRRASARRRHAAAR
jgi:predicted RNA-binding Zn ribbon-like protein